MSDSTFINLHEQMNTKGWIPNWEFNEVIDLYKYNDCTTIAECEAIDADSSYKTDLDDNGAWIYHLGSLTNGYQMFYNTNLESFSGDLSSLTNGDRMFLQSALQSFSGDLSKLTNGQSMFRNTAFTSFNGNLSSLSSAHGMFQSTPLESFNGDLSKLTNSNGMFSGTALQSFSGDLSKLTNGYNMFQNTSLTTFNGNLSSLTNGYQMFHNTYPRNYTIFHYKMENGVKALVETEVTSNGLKSFISNLSSLKCGYRMFGNYSTTCSPLSEESIMIIADTINDISTLDKSVESDWEYTYSTASSEITASIASEHRGILHLGYDTTIVDTTNIIKCCDRIADKGWTVYLNGAAQTANNGVIETISLTNEDGSPIPHYYKPIQVTDEEVAEFVDTNDKFYIIVGGQHVFGDDISTYGMFTSYEHAVSEITLGLGLTPCEKPDEEIL